MHQSTYKVSVHVRENCRFHVRENCRFHVRTVTMVTISSSADVVSVFHVTLQIVFPLADFRTEATLEALHVTKSVNT